MKLSKKAWYKFPVILDHIPGITSTASKVGAVIIYYCQNEPATIAAEHIAETIGCAGKSVKRAVYALEAADLIAVQRRPGLPSLYALTDHCRELCASALKPATEQRIPQYRSRRARRPLTQAEIDNLNEYMELSNRFEETE